MNWTASESDLLSASSKTRFPHWVKPWLSECYHRSRTWANIYLKIEGNGSILTSAFHSKTSRNFLVCISPRVLINHPKDLLSLKSTIDSYWLRVSLILSICCMFRDHWYLYKGIVKFGKGIKMNHCQQIVNGWDGSGHLLFSSTHQPLLSSSVNLLISIVELPVSHS